MKSTNIIRKIIKNQLMEQINEYGESGYYPAGAEFDSSAPYNRPNIEITFEIDYDRQKFEVTVNNGNFYEVDFIDFLEQYWKKNPGSYEMHERQFGQDEATMEAKIIEALRNQKIDFKDYLYDIGEVRGLLT